MEEVYCIYCGSSCKKNGHVENSPVQRWLCQHPECGKTHTDNSDCQFKSAEDVRKYGFDKAKNKLKKAEKDVKKYKGHLDILDKTKTDYQDY